MAIRSIIFSLIIHLIIIGALVYYYKKLADIKVELPERPITAEIITKEPKPTPKPKSKPIIPKSMPPIPKSPEKLIPLINPPAQILTKPNIPSLNESVKPLTPSEHIGALPQSPPSADQLKSSRNTSPLKGDIFDSDVIERHSIHGSAPTNSGNITLPDFEDTSKGGIAFQVENMKYYAYLMRLKETIQGKWHYPLMDQQKGHFGDLILELTINKDGSLEGVRLIRTSGHRGLDEAAINSIKDAAPFWRLPDDWNAKTLTIKGHFVYVLNMFRGY